MEPVPSQEPSSTKSQIYKETTRDGNFQLRFTAIEVPLERVNTYTPDHRQRSLPMV